MRVSINILICAGVYFMFPSHLFWGPANGQYYDDSLTERYFQFMEFEKSHRGAFNVLNETSFNISQCSIDLMLCLEDAPNDLLCSRSMPFSYYAYLDTICPMMRGQCHDYIPTFVGAEMVFSVEPCPDPYKEEDQ